MKKLMWRSKQIEHWDEIKNNSSKLNIKEKLNCGSKWENLCGDQNRLNIKAKLKIILQNWTLSRN